MVDDLHLVSVLGIGSLQLEISVAFVEIIVAAGLSVIPAFICGQILAFILLQDLHNKMLLAKSSIFKGTLLGTTLGATLCLLVGVGLGEHVSFDIWLLRSIIVTLLASLAGSWTAWRLFIRAFRQQPTSLAS
jgi:hypothetical protein